MTKQINASDDDNHSEIDKNEDEIILKKAKLNQQCNFQSSWISNSKFKDWISMDSDSKYNAQRGCCIKVFSIVSGGVRDVRSHVSSAKHIQAMSTRKSAGGMLQCQRGNLLVGCCSF